MMPAGISKGWAKGKWALECVEEQGSTVEGKGRSSSTAEKPRIFSIKIRGKGAHKSFGLPFCFH